MQLRNGRIGFPQRLPGNYRCEKSLVVLSERYGEARAQHGSHGTVGLSGWSVQMPLTGVEWVGSGLSLERRSGVTSL